jgi:hypothetical protein
LLFIVVASSINEGLTFILGLHFECCIGGHIGLYFSILRKSKEYVF